MKLSEQEKKDILDFLRVEKWYRRPVNVYEKMLDKETLREYKASLYPFMRLMVKSNSMTKEQARWEALRVFLAEKIRKGEL